MVNKIANSIPCNCLVSTENLISNMKKMINETKYYPKSVSLSNTVSAGMFTGMSRSGWESKCKKLISLVGRCLEPMARYIKGRTCTKTHRHTLRIDAETWGKYQTRRCPAEACQVSTTRETQHVLLAEGSEGD